MEISINSPIHNPNHVLQKEIAVQKYREFLLSSATSSSNNYESGESAASHYVYCLMYTLAVYVSHMNDAALSR